MDVGGLQGELLDNIEEMVSSSAEYTESGVKELVKAKDHQKSARKKVRHRRAVSKAGLDVWCC